MRVRETAVQVLRWVTPPRWLLALTILGLAAPLMPPPATVTAAASDGLHRPSPDTLPLAGALTIDLCAKSGSTTMPDGEIIPIWGFARKPAGIDCTDPSVVAQIPGPVLSVAAYTPLTITLTNTLAENVSVQFPGLNLMPDTVGAAPGATATYTTVVSDPGTYLYESGVNARVQVPMGLYGALIVRPNMLGRAYNDPRTAFNSEAVLVLSEIDPALNQSADPNAFDLLDFAPRYWLINGRAYPDTAPIQAAPGDTLLLRYLNAGVLHHSMQSVGFRQRIIASDADAQREVQAAVSVTTAPGQTIDALVSVPVQPLGTRYPLYNASQRLTNGASFPGGMVTFLDLAAPPAAPPNPCADENPPSGNTVSFDLWTAAGTVTMPDGVVLDIWGFTTTDPVLGGVARVPGPQLVVGAGDAAIVTLHNTLSESVSLVFPGIDLQPDTVGVPAGGSAVYQFMGSRPGTYLYESGVNARVQTAMGLFGAMTIASATPGQAYNCPETAFDHEATLVLSEFDPALNTLADPNAFDFLAYDPKYWLINGKAYPATDPILADPAQRVLLRYVNAGLMHHTMGIAGMHQRVVGRDANGSRYPQDVVSQLVEPGSTHDLIATLPDGTPPGTKYAIYDAQQHLTNAAAFPGGMLAFIIDSPLSVLNDCDTPVSMADALAIARYVVGLRGAIPCPNNADVSRDGRVSMVDALRTARIVVGLERN